MTLPEQQGQWWLWIRSYRKRVCRILPDIEQRFARWVLPRIVPNEMKRSQTAGKSFKKLRMKILTDSTVEAAILKREMQRNDKTPKGIETVEADIVFSAVGVTPNLEGIGLRSRVKTEKDKVAVDDIIYTTVPGMCNRWSCPWSALAHVAWEYHLLEKMPEWMLISQLQEHSCLYIYQSWIDHAASLGGWPEAGYRLRSEIPILGAVKQAIWFKEGFVSCLRRSLWWTARAHMIGKRYRLISNCFKESWNHSPRIIKSVHRILPMSKQ